MPKHADLLSVSLTEETTEEFPEYRPSEDEEAVIKDTFYKFRRSADERDQPLDIFDGMTLKQYVEESFRRYNTSEDIREDIEDWQSIVHDPMTRNKQNAIISRIITNLPIGSISFRNDADVIKASVLDDLYQYSEEADEYEMKMAHFLIDTITQGTGILYEGHRRRKKKYKVLSGSNDNPSIKETVEERNELYSKTIPLLEFYPSTIAVDTIREMPYCFRRQVVDFETFRQDYAEFPKAQFVQPHSGTETDQEPQPYFREFVSNDVQDGHVEIIKYYNQETCEYVIMANGVWLNPVLVDGKEVISPLPFEHGELPFIELKYEVIASGIFYGKSFPDRIRSMQDVLNALTNMMLDQAFLTVWPVILTQGIDSAEDDWLRPGRRIPIDTQGLPLRDTYERLDLGTPTGFHQWITEYMRKIIEESSVDRTTQGIAGIGGRTTAQEIRVAAQGVTSMLGMFGRYVNHVVKRKTEMRTKNIMQFWTDKNSPVIQIHGKEKRNKAFNTFLRDDVSLPDGGRGTRLIEMYKDQEDMPTKAELDARSDVFELETESKIQIVAITGSAIRDVDFYIKYTANPRTEETRDAQLALELEKVKVYLSFFPEMVNKEELLAKVCVKFGDDPAKIIKHQVLNPEQAEDMQRAQQSQVEQPMSPTPTAATTSNNLRAESGGIESPLDAPQM